MLRVLSVAFRPPSPTELTILIGIEDASEINNLIALCAPMIKVKASEKHASEVTFVNETVEHNTRYQAAKLFDISEDSLEDWQSDPRVKQFHGVLTWRCYSHIEALNSASSGTRDGDDEPTPTSTVKARQSASTKSKADCSYPSEHWLLHAMKGKPEFSEDLVGDIPTFWEQNSPERALWLREYLKEDSTLKHEGMTALHVAAAFGYESLTSTLLNRGHGGELKATNKSEYTPVSAKYRVKYHPKFKAQADFNSYMSRL